MEGECDRNNTTAPWGRLSQRVGAVSAINLFNSLLAGHILKQMLKHHSHIRMEATRAALESIVKKQSGNDASVGKAGAPGALQKPLPRQQNGHGTDAKKEVRPITGIFPRGENVKDGCSPSPVITRALEGSAPKSP